MNAPPRPETTTVPRERLVGGDLGRAVDARRERVVGGVAVLVARRRRRGQPLVAAVAVLAEGPLARQDLVERVIERLGRAGPLDGAGQYRVDGVVRAVKTLVAVRPC